MQSAKLIPTGISATSALAICGDVATAITAAGTTQATATALAAAKNYVSTTAASTGVLLPQGNGGDIVFVYNGGANTLAVYPPVGSQINNLAANTAVSVATLKSAYFEYASATQLASLLSA
jgi:hypothetical protein